MEVEGIKRKGSEWTIKGRYGGEFKCEDVLYRLIKLHFEDIYRGVCSRPVSASNNETEGEPYGHDGK